MSVSIFLFLLIANSKGQYEIPGTNIEIFQPKGLKVSIPDQRGIKKVVFLASFNKELNENAKDLLRKSIETPTQGFWSFEDKNVTVNSGDVLYYETKVDFFNGKETTTLSKGIQQFTIGITTTSKAPAVTLNVPCDYSSTMVANKRSCKGKLIFQDLFNDLSTNRWQTEIKYGGEPDYEFVIYQDNPENLSARNKSIRFTPTLVEKRMGTNFVTDAEIFDLAENCTGIQESFECVQKPRAWSILPPIFSSQITTKNRFSFVYGLVEIRAKLPAGDWIYPELYLKSKNDFYGAGYDSGLIKIAFAPGNTEMNHILSGGCIFGESAYSRYYGVKTIESTTRWSKDFHIFKLEWRPDGISLIVDNEVYGNVYPPDGGFVIKADDLKINKATAERWKKGTELAPFDKEMYLVLGVGVGGFAFPNKKDGKKPWSSEDPKAQLHFYNALNTWYNTWSNDSVFIVDYVRVWAL